VIKSALRSAARKRARRSMALNGFRTPPDDLLLTKGGGGSGMVIPSGGPLVIRGINLLVPKSHHHLLSDSPRHSWTSSTSTCSTCSRVMSHPITVVSPLSVPYPFSLMTSPLLRLLPPIPSSHVTRPYVLATVTCHLTPKWPVVHLLLDNIPVILLTCLPRPTDPSFK
jgi:hypothetical protein